MTTAKQTARKTKEVATTAKPVEKKKPAPKKVLKDQKSIVSSSDTVTVTAVANTTVNKIPVEYISGIESLFNHELNEIHEILEIVGEHIITEKYKEFYKKMEYFGCSDNEIQRLWKKRIDEL